MSVDIRLDAGFLGNLKTRKMIRELGEHAVVCTLRLWSYVALRHPKGVLSGMTEDDLEDIAGWTGERGLYVSYAIRMRWADKAQDGTLSIHDWKEHQPYIFHSDKRSEAAKVGAAARWEKYIKHRDNASRKRVASESQASRYAPTPAPAPAPKDLKPTFTIPPIIRPGVWQEFEDMRKRIKKPMTDHIRKLVINKLKRLGGDPNRILEESTMNQWAGVFPLKERDTEARPVDCVGRLL